MSLLSSDQPTTTPLSKVSVSSVSFAYHGVLGVLSQSGIVASTRAGARVDDTNLEHYTAGAEGRTRTGRTFSD